jgi:tetratricopeptide (TPR) repeat protein
MAEVLKAPQASGGGNYGGIYSGLCVFAHHKCYDEYLKLYSLYFKDLVKSGQFSEDDIFERQMMAADSFYHLKRFQESIDLLVPVLKDRHPNTEKQFSTFFVMKQILADAYLDIGEKRRAASLVHEVTSHPQLETTFDTHDLNVVLSIAIRILNKTQDWDRVTEVADRFFRDIPALFKSQQDIHVVQSICSAITAYHEMNENEKITRLLEGTKKILASSRETTLSKEQIAAVKLQLSLGFYYVGDKKSFIEYSEAALKESILKEDVLRHVPGLARAYYTQGNYPKAAEWMDKVFAELPLHEKVFTALCHFKAGTLRKARQLSLQIDELMNKETFMPVFNNQLYLCYAMSQSSIEKDHEEARSRLKRLQARSQFIVSLCSVPSVAEADLGLGLSFKDIAQEGDGVFARLQKYQLDVFAVEWSQETGQNSIFTWETKLPVNLKAEIQAAHAERKEKTKTTGTPDPEKSEENKNPEQQIKEAESSDMPLLLTTGARSLIECFESGDWKNVNAIRWCDIETFFSPLQQSQHGVVFTTHGTGTDHVTYTIYKRGSDLGNSSQTHENTAVTLVNKGSNRAPIKWYLKKKLRAALIEMGYLVDES